MSGSIINSTTTLRITNFVLTAIHLLAALLIIFLAYREREKCFNFELNTSLAKWFNEFFDINEKCRIKDNNECNTTYNLSSRVLVWLCIAFLFITSLFHVIYGINYKNIYADNAFTGRQSLRWIEYGITATIMAFIIAVISGVNNVFILGILVLHIIAVMATGWWFEKTFNDNGKGWIPILVGFGLLSVYTVIVFVSYLRARDKYNQENPDETLPQWITWIVIGTLIFFGCFGIVPVIRKIFNHEPIYSEYAYMVLSLTSKVYLGAFLAYGLLQRDE